jgi:site-specific recombinase XerC
MSLNALVQFLLEHLGEGIPEIVDKGLIELGVKRPGINAVTTVRRRFNILSVAHSELGLPNPCANPQAKLLMRRSIAESIANGWAPEQSAPITIDVLDRLLEASGSDLMGVRDRALLLFSVVSGGRRSSEVTEATIDRLVRVGADYEYLLGPTKTVRNADTGIIPLTGRGARAMDEWLSASGLVDGAIFRGVDRWGNISKRGLSVQTIMDIVRRLAKAAGLDATAYTGRSLRSGFMTEAIRQGVPLPEVMGMSHHRTLASAVVYYRSGKGLANRAARLKE